MLESLLRQPNRPEPWHDKRFMLSLDALRAFGLCKESSVLNFGGGEVFNRVLQEEVGCKVDNTEHDLRITKTFEERKTFDFALMMEVIEHLSDTPNPARVADWTYSGAENCLKTAAHCCKKLFLSTPNVCGFRSLINIIQGKHPHTFTPHTHEYAPDELRALVERCGWNIIHLWTVNSWNHHGLQHDQVQLARKLLKVAGAPTTLRNDNIFLIAERA